MEARAFVLGQRALQNRHERLWTQPHRFADPWSVSQFGHSLLFAEVGKYAYLGWQVTDVCSRAVHGARSLAP
jgi:hypothetical protein